MPWIGIKDDEKVIPEQVDDKVDVICPNCRERMRTRGPMADGRARHFFHIGHIGKNGGGEGGCEGGGEGESDVHRKYKSLTVSRLKELYPEYIDSCKPEQRLSTVLGDEFVKLPSSNGDRQADVMMLLEEPTTTFGRGLIAEVQYRNLGKDVEAATEDYIKNGFSVLWVDEDDFASDRCLLSKAQIRRRLCAPWPDGVPPTNNWGLTHPSPAGSLLVESVESASRSVTVPATLFLERWGRELDDIPPPELWGVSATKADWGFGRTTMVSDPPHFDPPIHKRQHQQPNRRSRDVKINARIYADWFSTDDSNSPYAAHVRKEIHHAYETGLRQFELDQAAQENQIDYRCDACGNVSSLEPGLHEAPFKRTYCDECGQTRMHVRLNLIDSGEAEI